MSRKQKEERDPLSKKIEKMYHNYGIDTSDMSDEEFQRMKDQYLAKKQNLDHDLRESEKFKERFADDIV